jgi:hypothetical protein
VDLPHSLQLLLPFLVFLSAPHEQVPVFGLASLNVHELVKLEDAPLATAPALAALVEDGCTRMMHTLLSLPIASFMSFTTALPPASHAILQCYTWVVVL